MSNLLIVIKAVSEAEKKPEHISSNTRQRICIDSDESKVLSLS